VPGSNPLGTKNVRALGTELLEKNPSFIRKALQRNDLRARGAPARRKPLVFNDLRRKPPLFWMGFMPSQKVSSAGILSSLFTNFLHEISENKARFFLMV